MKLNSFTDYCLRVLIYLAAQPERRATIAEIAEAYAINVNHLTKVVHFLGKQGWLLTIRGKGGGVALAQLPERINVGKVVREAEGVDRPAECFDREDNTCPITRICKLRGALREATQAFHHVLDGYTLADIAGNKRSLVNVLALA